MVFVPKSKSKIFNCFETIYLQPCSEWIYYTLEIHRGVSLVLIGGRYPLIWYPINIHQLLTTVIINMQSLPFLYWFVNSSSLVVQNKTPTMPHSHMPNPYLYTLDFPNNSFILALAVYKLVFFMASVADIFVLCTVY